MQLSQATQARAFLPLTDPWVHGSLQFMSCISLVGVDVKEVNYRKRKKSVPFSLIYDRFCMYFLFFRDLPVCVCVCVCTRVYCSVIFTVTSLLFDNLQKSTLVSLC